MECSASPLPAAWIALDYLFLLLVLAVTLRLWVRGGWLSGDGQPHQVNGTFVAPAFAK